MIYLIYIALCVEGAVSAFAFEWVQYGAASEFRVLIWMLIAFVAFKRIAVRYRAIILFLIVCQVWTFIVYAAFMFGIELSGHLIDSVSVAAVITACWLFIRNHERPSIAISTVDIVKDGCYFIIREPSTSYLKDIVLSLFGVPASSANVYLAGSVYGFNKDSGRYEVRKNVAIKSNHRYAIKINVEDVDEAHIVLSEMLGVKYGAVRCNCIGVLESFCKLIGVKLGPLQRIIPGLFVAKLEKAMS